MQTAATYPELSINGFSQERRSGTQNRTVDPKDLSRAANRQVCILLTLQKPVLISNAIVQETHYSYPLMEASASAMIISLEIQTLAVEWKIRSVTLKPRKEESFGGRKESDGSYIMQASKNSFQVKPPTFHCISGLLGINASDSGLELSCHIHI